MRKFLIAAIVLSMFASLAPAQAMDPGVGVWFCKLDPLDQGLIDKDTIPGVTKIFKPKGNSTCKATIPAFPIPPTTFRAVTSVGGTIDENTVRIDQETPPMPYINKVRRSIDNGGILYSEGTCANGFAIGTLLIQSPFAPNKSAATKPYDFAYVRVGDVAVVVAVNVGLDEALVGKVVFKPKETPTGLALRCADVENTGASTMPMDINFEGFGVVVSLKK